MARGYYTDYSYRGWVPWLHRYLRFATREDYMDYISASEEDDDE